MADASRDELIATTVSAIRSHWDRIGKRLLNGRWRPVETLCDCFEADTLLRRKSLARRFYSAEHVERMLSFSDASLIKNISFFVEAAVIQVWRNEGDESAKQRSYMRSLIKSEYVLVEDPDCEYASAVAYPARVYYDDWYERSVGADSTYEGYIMKSSGEAFTKREYEWMEASVEGQAEKSGEEGWLSETIHESPNRIFVRIFPARRRKGPASRFLMWGSRGPHGRSIALTPIEHFDAHGMRSFYSREDCFGRHILHMEVWRTTRGRIVARFWARNPDSDGGPGERSEATSHCCTEIAAHPAGARNDARNRALAKSRAILSARLESYEITGLPITVDKIVATPSDKETLIPECLRDAYENWAASELGIILTSVERGRRT